MPQSGKLNKWGRLCDSLAFFIHIRYELSGCSYFCIFPPILIVGN
uniref:Uncharacterized protein n=1 Tax=Anguilla anguilla TaxID=7936 RepID=A0A0E9S4M1_ANGAN